MSTYADDPWILANLDAPASASCSNLDGFVQKLKSSFSEGGWDVEDVPPRIKLITGNVAGFSFCTLGHSNVSFYTVGLDTDGIGVVDDPDACSACPNVSVPLIQITYGDQGERHEAMRAAIVQLYADAGVTVNPIAAVSDGDDLVTEFINSASSNCIDKASPGNQLNSSIPKPIGAGFIARSQDSGVAGNNAEVYVTYDDTPGTFFIKMYYRLGGWPSRSVVTGSEVSVSVYCNPPGEIKYIPATVSADHPWDIVEEEEGTTVVATEIPLNGQDIEFWANPYTMHYGPQPARIGNSASALCMAMKLKDLAGEGSDTFTKAVFFLGGVLGGSSLRERPYMAINRLALEIQGSGFDNISEIESVNSGEWGPLIFNSYSETVRYSDHPKGVVWNGGIAQVAEPWFACNFIQKDNSDFAPIIGQMWDTIIPYRGVELGFENHASQRPFPWDGKLWRYFQTRKGINIFNQATSMAFRVGDLRIYDGENYVGEVPATIVSVSISPSSISNGGAAVITVEINSAPSSGAFVVLQTKGDERMQFPDHVFTFSSGETTQNINVTTIGLNILENVTLTAWGVNTVTTPVTYLA